MNNQEREAFYAYGEAIGIPRLMQTCGEYHAFQAGAAYQREQDKGLVEALEALITDYDGEVHNEYDGTSMLDGRLAEIDYARKALATFRAAQEGK